LIDEVWQDVSQGAKDLINRLLSKASDRLTAKQALNHPWILFHTQFDREHRLSLNETVISRIASFSSASKI